MCSLSGAPEERPDNLPECIPWPFPDHWTVTPKARQVIHGAEPFPRPDGTPHPEVFRASGMKATIARGRLTKDYAGSTRTPDIDTGVRFGTGVMRK